MNLFDEVYFDQRLYDSMVGRLISLLVYGLAYYDQLTFARPYRDMKIYADEGEP